MVDRCKPSKPYGRRGITVCSRWLTFANFLADMGERPDGHELDRKNPRGNYTKRNTRWRPVRSNRQHNRRTLLTEAKRAEAARLRTKGVYHQDIAAALGVSKACVTDYFIGKAWS